MMMRKVEETSLGSKQERYQNLDDETEVGSIRDKIRRNL